MWKSGRGLLGLYGVGGVGGEERREREGGERERKRERGRERERERDSLKNSIRQRGRERNVLTHSALSIAEVRRHNQFAFLPHTHFHETLLHAWNYLSCSQNHIICLLISVPTHTHTHTHTHTET